MKTWVALVLAVALLTQPAFALAPGVWDGSLGTFKDGKLELPKTEPEKSKNPWAGKLGTFDAKHRLQNQTAPALRFSIRSFGAYFPNDGDFGLGFSLVPWWDPRRKIDVSLDLAQHRVGMALNYLQIPFLGLGVGLQAMYNTKEDRFEPGLKIQFKRW